MTDSRKPPYQFRAFSRVSHFLFLAVIIAVPLTPRALGQYDARSFGVRCDGSDESGTLNSALQSLPDRATFQLPCRAGIGPAGVVLRNKSGVVIEGLNGGGFQGLANPSGRVLFRVERCDGCTIRGLAINANNIGSAGLGVFYSTGIAVENNLVVNIAYPAQAGIVGIGNRNSRYTGNTVLSTHGRYSGSNVVDAPRGMWIGNAGQQSIEWNPVIANNTVRDIDATGFALHAAGATVTGNLAENTKGAGAKVTPPPGGGPQTIFSGNTFRRNLFHGIQINEAGSPVIVQNNVLDANQTGVYASGGGFVNSRVTGNTITASWSAGIYIYNANGSLIQGNRIQGNGAGGNGIVMEATRGKAIVNLQIAGNSISGIRGDAIQFLGRGGVVESVPVIGNLLFDNSRYGVLVEGSGIGGVSLVGNCFSNNRSGTLLDLRGILLAPLSSLSCLPSGGGRTYTPFRPAN